MAHKTSFKNILFVLFTTVLTLSLVACKTKVPSRYLSFDKVVDILYDYHLAEVLAQRDYNDSTAIISYKAYILKKHGVKEADLDSTLMYYTRHTELMHKVYQSLTDRFSNEAMLQGASVSEINQFSQITSSTDTADVWVGKKSLLLFPDASFNSYSFKIKTDTTYHKGDIIMLDFDTRFLYQDGMRSASVVLAVKHDNDSVTVRTTHMSSTNHYHLQIDDNDNLGIKELKGCFILNVDKTNFNATTLKMFSVSNIRMIRMHVKEDDKAKKDSSAKKDSVSSYPIDTHRKPIPIDTNRAVPLRTADIPPIKQQPIKK